MISFAISCAVRSSGVPDAELSFSMGLPFVGCVCKNSLGTTGKTTQQPQKDVAKCHATKDTHQLAK